VLVCLVRILQFEIQLKKNTAGDNYRHLWRMVYIWVRVTVMISELSVSGSEIFSYGMYKIIALFDFFTYSNMSHIGWFPVTGNSYAKK